MQGGGWQMMLASPSSPACLVETLAELCRDVGRCPPYNNTPPTPPTHPHTHHPHHHTRTHPPTLALWKCPLRSTWTLTWAVRTDRRSRQLSVVFTSSSTEVTGGKCICAWDGLGWVGGRKKASATSAKSAYVRGRHAVIASPSPALVFPQPAAHPASAAAPLRRKRGARCIPDVLHSRCGLQGRTVVCYLLEENKFVADGVYGVPQNFVVVACARRCRGPSGRRNTG